MPRTLDFSDSELGLGLFSHGDVYFMGPNDNQYVAAEECQATVTFYGDGPLGKKIPLGKSVTGALIIQHVPDGAAAAGVAQLGQGKAMRVYAEFERYDEEHKLIVANYKGFRLYALGAQFGQVIPGKIPVPSNIPIPAELTPAGA